MSEHKCPSCGYVLVIEVTGADKPKRKRRFKGFSTEARVNISKAQAKRWQKRREALEYRERVTIAAARLRIPVAEYERKVASGELPPPGSSGVEGV